MIGIYLMLLLIIIATVIAVESPDLFVSIVSFGLSGFGICIVFLMLGAKELSVLQLAAEIAILLFLMRATTDRSSGIKIRPFTLLIALIFAIVFLAGFSSALNSLSVPGIVRAGSAFRSFDLIGSAAAILAAVIGALVLMRPIGRKK